jgi:hypothetical protein
MRSADRNSRRNLKLVPVAKHRGASINVSLQQCLRSQATPVLEVRRGVATEVRDNSETQYIDSS